MLRRVLNWINRIPENKDIARYLYFAALILYVLIRTYETTMFPQNVRINNLGFLLALGLVGLKMLLYDGFSKKEFVFDIASLGIAAVSYLHGGSIHVLFMLWFAMGSHDMDFEDIIKVYLIVVASVFVLALAGSMLGIVEELLYDVNVEDETDFLWFHLKEAHSLGGIYSTDTAARIFFWLLAFFYMRGEKGSLLLSLVLLLLSLATYLSTHGRLDSICILILSIISFFNTLVNMSASRQLTGCRDRLWAFLGFVSMPAACLFSIAIAHMGCEAFDLTSVDETLVARLRIGHEALETYGVNLFGHEMKMTGNGGMQAGEVVRRLMEYNYVDVAYVQILLMDGILVLILLVGLYMYIAWKNRKDHYLMICIFLIAVNCMVAQHLLDISYVPFLLAYAAVNRRIPAAPEQEIYNAPDRLLP